MNIFKKVIKSFYYIKEIAIQELIRKYSGTFLGIFWSIVLPLARFSVYYFAVSVGLRRAQVMDGIEYIPWLLIGVAFWYAISEGVTSSARAYIRNKTWIISSTIKNVYFIYGSVAHVFLGNFLLFLVVIFGILPLYNISASLINLFAVYYYLAAIVLVLGIAHIIAPIVTIFRDLNYVVNVGMTFMFWLTPILYSHTTLDNMMWVAKVNPFYYCIHGMRTILLKHEMPNILTLDTAYFWGITTVIWVIAYVVYKVTKPIIPDII